MYKTTACIYSLLFNFMAFIAPHATQAQSAPTAQVAAGAARGSGAAERVKAYNIEKGKPALEGYDPVAYFEVNKPVEGKKEFSYTYEGVLYYFRNAASLNTFKSKPAQYEPQYGGWCAYAMGHDGTKVSVDPETYRILDGKLYLFYNSLFNNTLKTWLKAEASLKKQADANWPKYFKP